MALVFSHKQDVIPFPGIKGNGRKGHKTAKSLIISLFPFRRIDVEDARFFCEYGQLQLPGPAFLQAKDDACIGPGLLHGTVGISPSVHPFLPLLYHLPAA